MHADDQFDRAQRSDEARYFHAAGEVEIELPAGNATVQLWHGMESVVERRTVKVTAERDVELSVTMQPLDLPAATASWYSGDVHVHMNYGGIYRNTPANLLRQAEAEDLDVIFNLIVNKEQRIPDIAYFSAQADAASTAEVVIQHSQEFHTS
ncbi:MAG: hypothetical protein MUP20_00445, partial [Methyloceanibacter sp.]|nr:hypothetical protein [Methyloceanibacter sp.]